MNTSSPSVVDSGNEAVALPQVSRERAPLFPDEPQTLVEMFERTAEVHRRPDALNYRKDGEWRSISSSEIITRARHIALGLYGLGVRHGDRVALLSENRPEWSLSDAGCLFAGAVDVPIYTTQTPTQVSYILRDSEARVLLISNIMALRRLELEMENCAFVEHVILFDPPKDEQSEYETLSGLEARGRELAALQPELASTLARAVRPADLATIIYTSGTTGEPKGVMLTHANLVSNLIDSACHLSISEDDVVLSALPLSHVFERLAMYMYLHHGMAVYYAESLEKLGDNLREVRPTIFIGVPRIFEKIYMRIKDRADSAGRLGTAVFNWAVRIGKEYARHICFHRRVPPALAFKQRIATSLVFNKWREALGGRIRFFLSGGAALSEEIGYVFAGAGMPIIQGYGLTETSPVISAGTIDENRIGTVGRPIRNVEVRIAADGEIEVRGPNVMQGYYRKPEETRRAFTDDGWFRTGDIGTLDTDGFLRITDRKKELFKTSGGKYIAPQLIEQRIKQSRFVNQVVLVGDRRKFPAALIVPDWEQLRSYAQLKGIDARAPAELARHPRVLDLFQRQVDALTGDLAQYERVKRVALLADELSIEGGELTPTLKVRRRVVEEKYREVIDRIYEEP